MNIVKILRNFLRSKKIMRKILCALFVFGCALTVPLFVIKMHRKIDKRKTFYNILSQKYLIRLFYRDLLFFVIAFLTFIIALAFIVAIPKIANFYGNYALVDSGLLSNIAVVFSGILIRLFLI